MEKSKKLVLFDFDGVLINTLELAYEINRKTNPKLTKEEYEDISNGNFHEKWEEAKLKNGYTNPENFFEHYEKGIFEITIHDILHDAVLHLADSYILTIVTSSHGKAVSNFIKKENLEGCFSDILGYEVHTSKVVKIKSVLNKYDIPPENAVFITDTLGDINEANECGVSSIAVTWGMHREDNLKQGNPRIILSDPNNLAKAVESILC